MSRHPMQSVVRDDAGSPRFKENAIVRTLLDQGTLDMNKLAMMDFTPEDREQFAQLIGYSVGGFCELSYVSDESREQAGLMIDTERDEKDARITALELLFREVRDGMRYGAAALFGVHPSDLS